MEVKHKYYFSGAVGGQWPKGCVFYGLALFGDKVLTRESVPSIEFLYMYILCLYFVSTKLQKFKIILLVFILFHFTPDTPRQPMRLTTTNAVEINRRE